MSHSLVDPHFFEIQQIRKIRQTLHIELMFISKKLAQLFLRDLVPLLIKKQSQRLGIIIFDQLMILHHLNPLLSFIIELFDSLFNSSLQFMSFFNQLNISILFLVLHSTIIFDFLLLLCIRSLNTHKLINIIEYLYQPIQSLLF